MIFSAALSFSLFLTGQIERSGTDLLGRPQGQPEASDSGSLSARPKRLYFADLQMVVQTTTEGFCSEEKKVVEKEELEYRVELTPEKKILRKAGESSVTYYALNMTLRKIGFDQASYKFSVLDGVVPSVTPKFQEQIRVRRLPGNFIYIYYLDQVFKLQLTQTPVYSFNAKEERGSCTVNHAVNIFADNAGYYIPQ